MKAIPLILKDFNRFNRFLTGKKSFNFEKKEFTMANLFKFEGSYKKFCEFYEKTNDIFYLTKTKKEKEFKINTSLAIYKDGTEIKEYRKNQFKIFIEAKRTGQVKQIEKDEIKSNTEKLTVKEMRIKNRENKIWNELKNNIQSNYRMSQGAGEQNFYVRHYDKNENKIDINSMYNKRYGAYSRNCNYPVWDIQYNIFIDIINYSKIPDEIKVIGGLVTLWLNENKTINNIKIYNAKWVKQGKGRDLIIEEGIILTYKGFKIHAINEEQARKYLKNAIKMEQGNKTLENIKIMTNEEIIKKYGNVKITRNSSYQAGNCKSGTENWLNKYNLEEKKQAKIKDILSIDINNNYVRNACIIAIHKHLQNKKNKEKKEETII